MEINTAQIHYLLSRNFANGVFPLEMQWCKGVLPWKSRKFMLAPNCSNNSTITKSPPWHAKCRREQPWRQFPGSLESLILLQDDGSCCLFSFVSQPNSESFALSWWNKSTWNASSKVVFMIFKSETTIRR